MPNPSKSQNQYPSFAKKQFKQTLNSHRYVLETYKQGIDEIMKLDGDTPIFLDTSVILRIYEISFAGRDKIRQFLTSKKNRLFLTGQVQLEFIRNREKVINTFQEDVTEQLPKDFNGSVISKLSSFINSSKDKLEDYPEIQEKLLALQTQASDLLKNIQEKVNDKRGTAKSFLFEDSFLTLLSEVTLLETLEEKFLADIKESYKALLPNYKSSNNESFNMTCFPGCGEKGEKDDPTGDFIIFHEMMQYAAENKKNVIFLTNDTTKGDWMRKDGNPHIHYIENFYLNTRQLIYILNAERLFEKLFETSFESLISEKAGAVELMKLYELEYFLNNHPNFRKLKGHDINDKLLKELFANGIYTIDMLQSKLTHANLLVTEMQNHFPNISKVGGLRVSLDILDEKYVRPPSADATTEKAFRDFEEFWKKDYVPLLDIL